jgi:peroxiredoxin
VQVGDLVVWHSVMNDHSNEFDSDYGVIIKMAPAEDVFSQSVQVLFTDGEVQWMSPSFLEVVNESR